MIDCSSTWLSQDLPYAKAKIRENTKYWKSHTTLWKCQFSPTDYYDCHWTLTATERVYLYICYIHMKFLNYPECRYEFASLTSGALSKHEAVFDDCRSQQQIFGCFNFISSNFYWRHILKGKADGMHLKNHLLRRRRFSRFSDGIWQETWFGKW